MDGVWKKRAAEELGEWLLLNYTEEGDTRTLEILKGPDGKAARTITRRADGTLTVENTLAPEKKQVLVDRGELSKHVHDWITGRLIQEALAHAGPKAWQEISNWSPPSLGDVRDAAEEIERDCVSKAHMPANRSKKAKAPRLDSLAQDANRIIRAKLLRKETFTTADATFHPKEHLRIQCTDREYNEFVLNGQTIRQLEGTSPQVKAFYCEHMTNTGEAEALGHPGEIVRRVREKLDLRPSEWKIFCRIGIQALREAGIITPDGIRRACQNVAAVNRPKVPVQILSTIAAMTNTHERFRQIEWEAGNAWECWANVLARYVDQNTANYRSQMELSRIGDALMGTINAGDTWGPGDWDTLVARSERWHTMMTANRLGPGKNVRWPTAIDTVDTASHTFKAVTSSSELSALGHSMGNCLGTFWRQCSTGNSRIFRVNRKDKKRLAAAVEIQRTEAGWVTGQIEGPHRERPTETLRQECRELAARYQRAEAGLEHQHQLAA